MPLLTDVILPDKAFRWRKKVTLNSGSDSSRSGVDIGCLQCYFARFYCDNDKEWEALPPSSVESVVVADSACNSMCAILDLSSFVKLKHIVIGDECFRDASALIVNGLPELESFTCGNQSLASCSKVVFESDSRLSQVMSRLASIGLLENWLLFSWMLFFCVPEYCIHSWSDE